MILQHVCGWATEDVNTGVWLKFFSVNVRFTPVTQMMWPSYNHFCSGSFGIIASSTATAVRWQTLISSLQGNRHIISFNVVLSSLQYRLGENTQTIIINWSSSLMLILKFWLLFKPFTALCCCFLQWTVLCMAFSNAVAAYIQFGGYNGINSY